jgi:hypothetical protein
LRLSNTFWTIEESIMTLKRIFAAFVAVSVFSMGTLQPAHAALVSSEQVAQETMAPVPATDRARIMAAFSRPDVQAELVKRGVDPAQAQARIAALSDEEAAQLARDLDNAPAGAGVGGLVGAVVLVFLVLLVTDILGFTKVFPFTRSVR